MPGRRTTRLLRRDSAEVGVGTLIVFIAMVLVAAVAAAVIISTSGTLQERAMATGKEATAEVSSNVKVMSVYGERPSAVDDIEELHFILALSAGAQDVDLSTLVIRYSDGTNIDIYTLSTAPTFNLTWIRGSDSSNVMESGDLVDLSFTVSAGALPARAEFEVTMLPEIGSPLYLSLKTPATYGTGTTILLR